MRGGSEGVHSERPAPFSPFLPAGRAPRNASIRHCGRWLGVLSGRLPLAAGSAAPGSPPCCSPRFTCLRVMTMREVPRSHEKRTSHSCRSASVAAACLCSAINPCEPKSATNPAFDAGPRRGGPHACSGPFRSVIATGAGATGPPPDLRRRSDTRWDIGWRQLFSPRLALSSCLARKRLNSQRNAHTYSARYSRQLHPVNPQVRAPGCRSGFVWTRGTAHWPL
jgi:hypothetical protein